LDADVDVVDETGNRHIEGLVREALPLNHGHKRLDGAVDGVCINTEVGGLDLVDD